MGYINRGFIKTKRGQLKKHYTDFTANEIKKISDVIEKISNIKFCKHFYDKNLKISEKKILDCIKTGKVIEWNCTPSHERKRLLIRGNEVVHTTEGDCVVCAVYEIDAKTVVTAYLNLCDDHHNTLNRNYYKTDIFF